MNSHRYKSYIVEAKIDIPGICNQGDRGKLVIQQYILPRTFPVKWSEEYHVNLVIDSVIFSESHLIECLGSVQLDDIFKIIT